MSCCSGSRRRLVRPQGRWWQQLVSTVGGAWTSCDSDKTITMASQIVSLSSVLVSLLTFLVLKPPDDDSQMSQVTSQQPSAGLLASLGIRVRDFAYENTLPAINPVPRVPRQVQPTPPSRKRAQSDDCDDTPIAPATSQLGAKRQRALERRPTEPLQEPPVQPTRTLGRITLTRVCSIIIPALPAAPHTRFSASPPTSPLTPPFSQLASQDSQLVQTPSAFPFVVHVDDTSMISTSKIDSESQPSPFRPTLYSRLSRPSLHCSPAPSSQNASPAPFLELTSPNKELKADSRARKRRDRGIAGTVPSPSPPYQLRRRPIPSPHASTLSRHPHQATSTSPRRTRLMR